MTPDPPPTIVSPQQAQALFDLANSRICCPTTAGSPCIPFTYPDNGCWARASEMCRLIIGAGVQPQKVWIYGSLEAATQNRPACHVDWFWHVAPILLVDTGATPEVQVIDPSLFPGPVTQSTWASVQGDPLANLVHSDASVYWRGANGAVTYDDAAYTYTNADLSTYRNQLMLRSVSPAGPPPYDNCITNRSGVQWFGMIDAGTTQLWFTWGWPAAWHVVWTMMPLTSCPGGPHLSWRVEVERSSANQCTYWITVKNLSSDPIRFAGRYDILRM